MITEAPPSNASNSSLPASCCPRLGLRFFATIHGKPTYGGPFESYTTPTRGADGVWRSEKFDHDSGEWIAGGKAWQESEITCAE